MCTYVSGPFALKSTGEEINLFRAPGVQRQEKPRVNRRAKPGKPAPVSAELVLDMEREGSLYFPSAPTPECDGDNGAICSHVTVSKDLGPRVGWMGFAKSGFAADVDAFTITCARLFVLVLSMESCFIAVHRV